MDYERSGRFLLACALALALSSCQLAVAIDVQQLDNGGISIQSNDGSNDPPCIDTVNVTLLEEGKAPIDSLIVWRIDRKFGSDECFSKIVYPKVPENYSGESIQPLQPGRRYLIEVFGMSWSASQTIVRSAPK